MLFAIIWYRNIASLSVVIVCLHRCQLFVCFHELGCIYVNIDFSALENPLYLLEDAL